MSEPEINLDELYSELIIELANSKKHRGQISFRAEVKRGINPNCGDDIEIAAEIMNGKVARIWRGGRGCAIAEASAEILAEKLTGKTLQEAEEILELFLKMARGDALGELELKTLGDAQILKGVAQFPARIKCATLAWHTMGEILAATRRG